MFAFGFDWIAEFAPVGKAAFEGADAREFVGAGAVEPDIGAFVQGDLGKENGAGVPAFFAFESVAEIDAH